MTVLKDLIIQERNKKKLSLLSTLGTEKRGEQKVDKNTRKIKTPFCTLMHRSLKLFPLKCNMK